MANCIKMTVRGTIITLCERGWSNSRIARELNIHRGTVARYRQLGRLAAEVPAGTESKPSIVPAGKAGSKCTILPPGKVGRRSQCEAYAEQIDRAVEKGLSAQRIWQDLLCDYGFEGSYDCVKRYVRRKKAATPRRIWRMEALPGEEAQVDFGAGAWIKGSDGRRRRSWIFRIVLSCSRKGYAEAVFRQDTETFIRCLENAFRHFGGVAHTLCIDNLRAAVSKPDWYEPQINPKLESFCRHYGTVILPCRVRKPEHKGKVESSVKYVKNNALKGREFTTLVEENKHLMWWEETVADGRIHGTTRQQIRTHFQKIEKSALLSLPASLFPCFQEGQRKVHRDSYVEVEGSYYEVPCEYIGRQVWARWDGRTVRIFNRELEQIRSFAKQPRGQFSHSLGARGRRSTITMEHDMAWWIQRCARMGSQCGLWAVEVMAEKDVRGIRVLQGLVGLKRKYTNRDLDHACEQALGQSAYHLRDLKGLLERPQKQESFEFMDKHPLIREMGEYSSFLDMLYPDEQRKEAMR